MEYCQSFYCWWVYAFSVKCFLEFVETTGFYISLAFSRLLWSLVTMESYCNIYNTFFAISDNWYFGDALFEKFRDVKNIEFEWEPNSGRWYLVLCFFRNWLCWTVMFFILGRHWPSSGQCSQFFTFRKRQKTALFSGGIKWKQWPGIG